MKVHEISKEWVARMTTLVECWNKLDGNVGELSSWVNQKVISKVIDYELIDLHFYQDSAAPEGKSELSIEKLETQLNTLKTMFAEKQKLVADLEVYGAVGAGSTQEEEASAPAATPAEEAPAPPSEEAPAPSS